MDFRFRPISFEIIIVIGAFLFLMQSGILPMDILNPITFIVLALFVIECIRILYKLRSLRKQGVDISEQSFRSLGIDTISPDVGNAFAILGTSQVVVGSILTLVIIVYILFFK